MAISIIDHELPDVTHNLYDVTFFQHTISTIVTDTPSYVDSWIAETERLHNRSLRSLVVGLDVEWRPNQSRNIENPVATLQLCVEHRCLIFQILRSRFIPRSLINFLRNPNYTFTGVGIESDVEKLTKDYNLVVARMADVRTLAADAYGVRELKRAGIKSLTERILGKEVNKPKEITLSRWDNQWLTAPQVQYACIDAFLSFEIGWILISGYATAEGRPVRERRLPCCGIGIGWFLFIIGFFLVIPWYFGALILLCARYDHREKPGYIACLIAAILGTLAVIFGVTNDDWDWDW